MLVAGAIVVIAKDDVVFDFSGEPLCGDVVDIAGTAADDFDLVCSEYVDCTFTHVACEHDAHAHVGEDGADVGFAAAAFGGGHGFFVCDLIVAVQSENGVVITMAEMVVDLTVAGG